MHTVLSFQYDWFQHVLLVLEWCMVFSYQTTLGNSERLTKPLLLPFPSPFPKNENTSVEYVCNICHRLAGNHCLHVKAISGCTNKKSIFDFLRFSPLRVVGIFSANVIICEYCSYEKTYATRITEERVSEIPSCVPHMILTPIFPW